jgi:deoxyuridine 5'-triphosphate nucleotidohydrolase
VAANTNLITSFIRRISKYFDSSNFTWPRPKRVAPGANHIDNPTDFDARTIYRGEEIVDFTQGKLYTQDGGEIVELNSPSQIIDGLRTVTPSVVGAFGGGALYVSVESGAVRINGKNYYHESAGGTAVNGDITIAPNTVCSEEGYYSEIVPRSSISKSGYMLSNSVGIIDQSYRGNIMVSLTKIDSESPDIELPFKCCQLIIRKQYYANMIEVGYSFDETDRNEGGYGSTSI